MKFFINPENESYLRELAKEFNESTNSVRRELNNLSEAGYLTTGTLQNKVTYRANTSHPLYRPLHNMIRQSLGLESMVKEILDKLGGVERIVLVGEYAQGRDSGCIEVVVIGSDVNESYLDIVAKSIEKKIERKVEVLVQSYFDGPGIVLYDINGERSS
jgi:hypothetical protein